jgi:hypothetical protein
MASASVAGRRASLASSTAVIAKRSLLKFLTLLYRSSGGGQVLPLELA